MRSDGSRLVSSGARIAPRTRRLIVVLLLVLVVVGALLVHHLGARPPTWYPPCWFHEATGLHCPGCGTARAMHALVRGDVLRALDQNLIAVVMVPVLAVWAGVTARRAWLGHRFSGAMPGGWAISVLVAVVIFSVLRNLPWWPFVLLAPD